MDKIKRIINYVSWGIIGITGFIFVVNWKNIPASVITHIGFVSVSYGSKYTLIIIFVIEIIANLVFTLGYDIPYIKEVRKTRQPSFLVDGLSIVIQSFAVLMMSAFILQTVW